MLTHLNVRTLSYATMRKGGRFNMQGASGTFPYRRLRELWS